MLTQPNPSVPLQVDNVTGQIVLPTDSSAGLAVCAEANAAGNLYLVPINKTFTGVAMLVVGIGGTGTVNIQDAGAVIKHSNGGHPAPGAGVPSLASGVTITPITVAGGGTGNQLSVVITGGSSVISAVVAGYVK